MWRTTRVLSHLGMATNRIRPRALAWGTAGTTLLAGIVVALSVTSLHRTRLEVGKIVREAESSTHLVNDLGRLLARNRATVLDAAVSPGADLEDVRTRNQLVGTRLGFIDQELDEMLARDEQIVWRALRPRIASHRANLREILARLEANDLAGAVVQLEVVTTEAREIQDAIDRLAEGTRRHTLEELARADRRMRRMVAAQTALGILLVSGLLAIWMVVRRTVRRQQGQIEEYVARIEDANRELDAFAGRVAHDMRNALGPLPLSVARLRALGPANDEFGGALERIDRVSLRATRLVDGLLAFARAERPSEGTETASIPSAVQEVLEEHEALIAAVGARVVVSVEDVPVGMPPELLHVALSNVVSNALKYLDGQPSRHVDIRARRVGELCDLVVEDSGPGIPPAAIERLFQPFYRVPGTRVPGVGLGLSTVRRVVEAHGGTVSVASDLGQRTTVRMVLPVGAAADGREGGDDARVSNTG